MTRSLAVAACLTALAAPASASGASLNVVPEKPCYRDGEAVNLIGADFTPRGSATITRNGKLLSALDTDASGAFNGLLTLAQSSGRQTRTYTATDRDDPTRTASTQITVSAVRARLTPNDGAPGRMMRISARGFTTGTTLWAHVVRGKSRRHLRIGRLKGACGALKARRRLLPRDAAFGVHRIQFDTFRRYKRDRRVQDSSTITVSRG
jgi:hypothetical protein